MNQVDWGDLGNQKGSGNLNKGKIVKGFHHSAVNKAAISSIPTKYEVIVLPKSSSKAFGSSADRFSLITQTNESMPGPGKYLGPTSGFIQQNSTDKVHSLKGLLPQSRRFADSLAYASVNSGPGPGTYNFPSMSQKTMLPTNPKTHKKPSSMFLAAKGPHVQASNHEIPGPGHYDISQNTIEKKSQTEAKASSVFVSGTGRDGYEGGKVVPPPGSYNINRNLAESLGDHHTGFTSAFMPRKNHRKRKSRERVEELLNVSGHLPRQNVQSESHRDTSFDTGTMNGDENAVFKLGIKDRFGDYIEGESKLKPGTNLGPGTYMSKDLMGKSKSLVSGSAFMSETKRNPFGLPSNSNQTQNSTDRKVNTGYNPAKAQKKVAFHYNYRKIWV